MADLDSGERTGSGAGAGTPTRAERRRQETTRSRRDRANDRRDAAGPPGASGAAGPSRRRRRKPMPFWQELPVLILIAIVLALLIKTFLVQAFYIPSESMQNTLQVRDRVLVNKLVFDFRSPHRGEVIVFNNALWQPEVPVAKPKSSVKRSLQSFASAIGLGPPNEKDYIKRVIGLPGDTVQCCDDNGRVTVNGHSLVEPYIFDNTPQQQRAFGPIKVPAGRLWVMGDHRGVSADSRAHADDPWHGTVPIDHVVGRAFVIVWPIGRAGGLPVPASLQKAMDAPLLPLLPALPIGAVGLLRRRRGSPARS
ncbi:MAG: signal peptidase I [Actinomycetota bacterium]|nr:signal peptidase I [Actinomycetota bacterium]